MGAGERGLGIFGETCCHPQKDPGALQGSQSREFAPQLRHPEADPQRAPDLSQVFAKRPTEQRPRPPFLLAFSAPSQPPANAALWAGKAWKPLDLPLDPWSPRVPGQPPVAQPGVCEHPDPTAMSPVTCLGLGFLCEKGTLVLLCRPGGGGWGG